MKKGLILSNFFTSFKFINNEFSYELKKYENSKSKVNIKIIDRKLKQELQLSSIFEIPFSFIINNEDLLFYIRKNCFLIINEEFKQRFKISNKQIKSNKELSIKLTSYKDILDLFLILFIEKFELKINVPLIHLNRSNEFEEQVKENSIDLANKESYKMILTKIRTQQSGFRNKLLEIWLFKCGISKITQTELLEACHIKPFCECEFTEYYDLNNGIILTSCLHKLFDNYLITFDSEGALLISNKLSIETKKSLRIETGIKLNRYTEKMDSYMTHHRLKFEYQNN